jgi:hypothetical protein
MNGLFVGSNLIHAKYPHTKVVLDTEFSRTGFGSFRFSSQFPYLGKRVRRSILVFRSGELVRHPPITRPKLVRRQFMAAAKSICFSRIVRETVPFLWPNGVLGNSEDDWNIVAEYPGADPREITGLKDKADVDDWINGDRRVAWLRSQGYAK